MYMGARCFNRYNMDTFFVKDLTGRTYDCEVDVERGTIKDLKQCLFKKYQIPVANQLLIFAGKQCEANDSLTHFKHEGTPILLIREKGVASLRNKAKDELLKKIKGNALTKTDRILLQALAAPILNELLKDILFTSESTNELRSKLQSEDYTAAASLLNLGANVSSIGGIVPAILGVNPDLLKVLLQAGASPNAIVVDEDTDAGAEETALEYVLDGYSRIRSRAMKTKLLEIVRLLLTYGGRIKFMTKESLNRITENNPELKEALKKAPILSLVVVRPK